MSLYHLDRIFHPESVAVIGASETGGSVGRAVTANLIDGGFGGKLFPVNPKYERVFGHRCYGRIADAPSAADLPVIAVPVDQVPAVIEECVAI